MFYRVNSRNHDKLVYLKVCETLKAEVVTNFPLIYLTAEDPSEKDVVSRPSLPLIKAVARANGWMERLLSGEISTLEDLASETGFTRRYISRTLRSSFLAPDLTEMILDGLQPPDLTVRRLMAGFPPDWPAQRRMLKGSSP